MDSLPGKANIEALVELYSYKVNDLAQGKYPLGGELSVHKLRRYLMVQKLPGSLRVEFGKADRTFRLLGNLIRSIHKSKLGVDFAKDTILLSVR